MANATRISDWAYGPFVGKYTGTTAALNVHIGFKPSLIFAVDWTDGTIFWFWTKDDITKVTKIDTAAATVSTAVTQVDDGTTLGFGLPAADAVTNINGKVFYFIAFPE